MSYRLLCACLLLVINTSVVAEALPVYQFSFYHAEGTQVLDEHKRPAQLRGVAFGNEVWADTRIPTLHHTEEDYKRVRDLGMNLVRFYLNYRTLEDDAKPYVYLDDGWEWIDKNIAWAKAQGVYLVLNVHIPQGGFQSLAKGVALWESPELQQRLIAMWQAIAKRYAGEPVVFGYDLVNEPGVTQDKQQWQSLAQRIAHAIREVDKRHPIIVERVNSVKGSWENDKELNFVKISDPNLIYTFHFYDPFSYTHQYADWVDYSRNREGGAWPDEKRGNTRAALAKSLDQYLAWGKANNVPLYLGEWGVYKTTFEKGRGGVNWVKDMLELIEERQLINTYHTYHEAAFGIYRGNEAVDPENRNEELYELFIQQNLPRNKRKN